MSQRNPLSGSIPSTNKDLDSLRRTQEIKSEETYQSERLDSLKIPSPALPIKMRRVEPSVHLLSYLEKSKIKEDMRRLISAKVIQLRVNLELDYFEQRSAVRQLIGQQNIPETDLVLKRRGDKHLDQVCHMLTVLDQLLTNVKSCDNDFPNLPLLNETAGSYLNFLTKNRPSIYYSSEEVMKRFQDKVSLCKSVTFTCEIYMRNVIWKEHLEGNIWENVEEISDE